MQGWVKLHRKLTEWEWYTDVPTKTLFIHLLLVANHELKFWRGQPIDRGELVTSVSILSKETGLSKQQVRTALDKLTNSNQIEKTSTNRYTFIKVLSYAIYQGSADDEQQTINKPVNKPRNKPSNKQITSQATSKKNTDNALGCAIIDTCKNNEQQTNNEQSNKPINKPINKPHNNKQEVRSKEYKNNIKDIYNEKELKKLVDTRFNNVELRSCLYKFIQMRNKKKKPLSDSALVRQLNNLERLSADTNEQIEIVTLATDNFWSGFWPLKKEGTDNGQNNIQSPTRSNGKEYEILG